MLCEPPSTDPADVAWGSFMHWLELETCSDGVKGETPLIPSTANDHPWEGMRGTDED